MQLSILYFASLREQLARSREALEVPSTVRTVGDLRSWMLARGEPFASALARGRAVRIAVNQQMADEDVVLPTGAEVAFFPPVTGG
jgi:molybdopterin synthase sulfur carrier subunit